MRVTRSISRRGCLLAGEDEIKLRPKSFELLRYLVENPGRLVLKDELVEAVWPNVIVSDDLLAQSISDLRNALDDVDRRIIKTVTRRGYLFAAPVSISAPNDATALRPVPDISAPFARAGLVPPRLSIVVLPFTNLSNKSDQQYFADGITDDLMTDLSRLADMLVISRNTAFTYRNKAIDTKQIGHELCVRYVLEGSARRSGNRVRINVQLISAETDTHLWAERFDADTSDLFTVQDEITGRIAVALNLELVAAEIARPPKNLDALDYILRGRSALNKPFTPDNYAEAIDQFEHALALDPQSLETQSWLASALAARVMDQMTASTTADIRRAEALVKRIMMTSPSNTLAHFTKGQVLRVQKRYAEAAAEYETVIALNRNYVNAFGILAECKLFAGPIHEMIPLHERAIRLSPRDPQIGIWYFRIGVAHPLQSRIDEAIEWLERARGADAALPYVHSHLASAYALKGEAERAAIELVEARILSGDNRYSSLARLRTLQYYGVHNIEALYEATYFAGLRKAGMPEE